MRRKLPMSNSAFDRVFERPEERVRIEARAKKPSVDAARSRLGGRPSEAPSPSWAPGSAVLFQSAGGSHVLGIVLWASAREAHVMLDGSRLKRVAPELLAPADGAPLGDLTKIASDARMFAMLVEGQAVRYADEHGAVRDGNVVEKCRYGALVLRGDGAVVAVGFRKLFPAPTMAAGTA